MAPFPNPIRLGTLLLFLVFGQHLDAANLAKYHEPKGNLKVGLDYELVTNTRHIIGKPYLESSHRWVFTSYLEFKGSTASITDGQLTKMGFDAYTEMQEDLDQYDPEQNTNTGELRSLPNAMTVMAFDENIIFASSLKGRKGFLDKFPDDNPLKKALETCQAIFDLKHSSTKKEEGHRVSASCGEISAFWRYYQLDSPNRRMERIGERQPRARVTTIGRHGNTGPVRVVPPCGKGNVEQFGCHLLVTEVEKVDYIYNAKPEPYDLEEVAGGVFKKGQINSCRKNRIKWYE